MPTTTYLSPESTNEWFRDASNRLTKYKRQDETEVYTATTPLWDLTDILIESETISSATYDAEGGLSVTGTGQGNATCYGTVTNTGSVKITVTTSASRVLEERFYFIPTDQPERDYRG